MTGYLIDTNIVSELARQRPEPRVVAFVSGERDLWLSAVSIHEIAYGIARVRDPLHRTRLTVWFKSVSTQFGQRILAVDSAVAMRAGRLRAAAEAQGRKADALDALIGATAIEHSLVLATRNVRDFEPFGLTPVDPWSR